MLSRELLLKSIEKELKGLKEEIEMYNQRKIENTSLGQFVRVEVMEGQQRVLLKLWGKIKDMEFDE